MSIDLIQNLVVQIQVKNQNIKSGDAFTGKVIAKTGENTYTMKPSHGPNALVVTSPQALDVGQEYLVRAVQINRQMCLVLTEFNAQGQPTPALTESEFSPSSVSLLLADLSAAVSELHDMNTLMQEKAESDPTSLPLSIQRLVHRLDPAAGHIRQALPYLSRHPEQASKVLNIAANIQQQIHALRQLVSGTYDTSQLTRVQTNLDDLVKDLTAIVQTGPGTEQRTTPSPGASPPNELPSTQTWPTSRVTSTADQVELTQGNPLPAWVTDSSKESFELVHQGTTVTVESEKSPPPGSWTLVVAEKTDRSDTITLRSIQPNEVPPQSALLSEPLQKWDLPDTQTNRDIVRFLLQQKGFVTKADVQEMAKVIHVIQDALPAPNQDFDLQSIWQAIQDFKTMGGSVPVLTVLANQGANQAAQLLVIQQNESGEIKFFLMPPTQPTQQGLHVQAYPVTVPNLDQIIAELESVLAQISEMNHGLQGTSHPEKALLSGSQRSLLQKLQAVSTRVLQQWPAIIKNPDLMYRVRDLLKHAIQQLDQLKHNMVREGKAQDTGFTLSDLDQVQDGLRTLIARAGASNGHKAAPHPFQAFLTQFGSNSSSPKIWQVVDAPPKLVATSIGNPFSAWVDSSTDQSIRIQLQKGSMRVEGSVPLPPGNWIMGALERPGNDTPPLFRIPDTQEVPPQSPVFAEPLVEWSLEDTALHRDIIRFLLFCNESVSKNDALDMIAALGKLPTDTTSAKAPDIPLLESIWKAIQVLRQHHVRISPASVSYLAKSFQSPEQTLPQLFHQLYDLIQTVRPQSLPQASQEVMHNLTDALEKLILNLAGSDINTKELGQTIQQKIEDSGIFYESKVLKWLPSSQTTDRLQQDMKATLLEALRDLAAVKRDDLPLHTEVREQIFRLLGGLEQRQLVPGQRGDPFFIPLMMDGKFVPLEVIFRRSNRRGMPQKQGRQVAIQCETSRIGRVWADLNLFGKQLSVTVRPENKQAIRLFQEQETLLRQHLDAMGIVLGSFIVKTLEMPEPEGKGKLDRNAEIDILI